MIRKLVLGVLIFAISPVSFCLEQKSPEYRDGNYWLRAVTLGIRLNDGEKISQAEMLDAIAAASYLSGFQKGIALSSEITGSKPFGCYPTELKNFQTFRIFKKYLEEHPEVLHEDGLGLFLVSITKAFPCPKP